MSEHWTYFYGMRLRGFSPGAQPKDGLIDRYELSDLPFKPYTTFYDVIGYNRKLSAVEEIRYDLEYIGGMCR